MEQPEDKFKCDWKQQFSPFQRSRRQITDREQTTLNEILKGLSLPPREERK